MYTSKEITHFFRQKTHSWKKYNIFTQSLQCALFAYYLKKQLTETTTLLNICIFWHNSFRLTRGDYLNILCIMTQCLVNGLVSQLSINYIQCLFYDNDRFIEDSYRIIDSIYFIKY